MLSFTEVQWPVFLLLGRCVRWPLFYPSGLAASNYIPRLINDHWGEWCEWPAVSLPCARRRGVGLFVWVEALQMVGLSGGSSYATDFFCCWTFTWTVYFCMSLCHCFCVQFCLPSCVCVFVCSYTCFCLLMFRFTCPKDLSMGGDLRGERGNGPPKFEVGDSPCIRPPNISRSSVIGCVAK